MNDCARQQERDSAQPSQKAGKPKKYKEIEFKKRPKVKVYMSADTSKFAVPDTLTKQMISFPYSQAQKEYFKWIQKNELFDDSAKFKVPESKNDIAAD